MVDDAGEPVRLRLKRLRERSGLSQGRLATAINMHTTTYANFENRYAKRFLPLELIQSVASHLIGRGDPPITPAEVYALAGAHPPLVARDLGNARFAPDIAPLPEREEMQRNVPVFGTAAGSDGDGSFYMNEGQPVDYVRRPPAFSSTRQIFAIYVQGDSMSPKYEHGALVYLDPIRPPSPGAYVVFTVEGAEGGLAQSYIKRLTRRTAEHMIVEQFNPPRELRFPTARISRLFRVMDLEELLGV